METLSRLCWGFFNIADVARGDTDNFPNWMRQIFYVFAECWYFAAMMLQGDAATYWQDFKEARRTALPPQEQMTAAVFA